jgi:integrase
MPAQVASSTVASFLAYLTRRGRAENTRVKYGRYLRDFAQWAGERDPGEIPAHQIELEYLGRWHARFEERRGHPPAPHTLRLHIGALRSYYAFLERFDLISRNPMRQIDSPKPPQRANDWLSPAEDEALLQACETPHERVVLWLLRFSGLRIGEARGLRNRDIDLGAGTITVRTSKTTAGRRVIPILTELRPHIQAWQRHQMARGLLLPRTALSCDSERHAHARTICMAPRQAGGRTGRCPPELNGGNRRFASYPSTDARLGPAEPRGTARSCLEGAGPCVNDDYRARLRRAP